MAILMEEQAWMNSQLSIARYFGGIRLQDSEYHVMPPMNDLIDADFIKYYERLGRDRFIEILSKHNRESKSYLHGYFTEALQRHHVKRKKVEPVQLSLF